MKIYAPPPGRLHPPCIPCLTNVRQWRIIFLRAKIHHGHHRNLSFHPPGTALLSDEGYRRLQMALVLRPEMGAVIPGSGGLRKVRWANKGRGKSGGVRAIYYWAVAHDRILMLFMYAKNEQDDLTAEQLMVLRRMIEEEYS